MLLQLAKKVATGGYQSRRHNGDGDYLDNGIKTSNGINGTNQENGIQVKPYSYLSLLTEIMSQLLKDPEAKEADFNRWMFLTSFDGTNVTIIDLVFGILPLCAVEFAVPVLLPSHLPSRQGTCGTTATSGRSSLKDHIVPILSAFIFRLPVESFDKIESTLLKNLLDSNSLKTIIAADIWCLISRSNDDLRIQTIDMLMKIHGVISSSCVKSSNDRSKSSNDCSKSSNDCTKSSNNCTKSCDLVGDHKVIAIEILLNRLLRFHAEFDLDVFLNKIDIFDHTYLISGLKNLPQSQLTKMVKKASVKYLSKEVTEVRNLVTLCQLMRFQEEPDDHLVTQVLSICLKSESDQGTFHAKNCHQIRCCLLMLSKFLKVSCINQIVTNCESAIKRSSVQDFHTVYFVFQLLHACAERIAKSRKYRRSIVEKSFNIVNGLLRTTLPTTLPTTLLTSVWLEFGYRFCVNVTDARMIIDYFSIQGSKSPPGPRILFHKFMCKEDKREADKMREDKREEDKREEDKMNEEKDATVQGLSAVSLRGLGEHGLPPFPLLVTGHLSKKASEEIEVIFESKSQETENSSPVHVREIPSSPAHVREIPSSLAHFREIPSSLAHFRETLNHIAQNPTLLDQYGSDLADIAILINGILREPEE